MKIISIFLFLFFSVCSVLGSNERVLLLAVDQNKKSFTHLASLTGKKIVIELELKKYLTSSLFHEKLLKKPRSHARAIVFISEDFPLGEVKICWIRRGRFEDTDGNKYRLSDLSADTFSFEKLEVEEK